MTLFDTHTHLYLDEFDADRLEVVNRAIDAGVGKMLFPNVDCSTIVPMKQLHNQFPSNTFMAIGLHPTEVGEDYSHDLQMMEKELASGSYVAVGEIGIDLYWDKNFEQEQMDVFFKQVGWAVSRNLPIIIHCRNGLDRVLEVLDAYRGKVGGVFHSFGGTPTDIERIRERGDFYFGINGIVTFKNSTLRSTLPAIGIDRIVLETDAPYLAPVPYRGKRNEPSYIFNTAGVVAESLGVDIETVGAITTINAKKLFNIVE